MEIDPKIFTVDVEEYYHAENILYSFPEDKIATLPDRLEIGLRKLLNLLEQTNNKATFFILGCVAEKNKNLIKEISIAGHEIASHGYDHIPLHRRTPETFEKDLDKSIKVLSDITGQKIIGFRATGFSLSEGMEWFFDILTKFRIIYDSSLCLSLFRQRSLRFIEKQICLGENKGILEFPPTHISLGPFRLPLGGGYFRAYPYWLTKWGLSLKHPKRKTPPLFYIHPWELDPQQSRFNISPIKYLRHYLNLQSTEEKLQRLLVEMGFISVRDFLKTVNILTNV